MAIALLLVVAGAAALTVLASAVIYGRSSRSALSNMAFAMLLTAGAVAILMIIAAIVSWFAARTAFRPR